MNFDDDVYKPICAHLNTRGIKPSTAKWSVVEGDPSTIIAEVKASSLLENLQDDEAAVPSFLVSFMYWLERITGTRANCRLEIRDVNSLPRDNPDLWRSLFLLEEFGRVLGNRFDWNPRIRWDVPRNLMLNSPAQPRPKSKVEVINREADLEEFISGSQEMRDSFSAHIDPVSDFDRQFPMGFFDGAVKETTHVSPGGKEAIDLWTHAEGTKTLHLFELKWDSNKPVGILPECVYYARAVHYLRRGDLRGGTITPDKQWDGTHAVTQTVRTVMWLSATEYHPLVFSHGDSPLTLFNKAYAADGLEFRVLPLRRVGTVADWDFGNMWPAERSG